MTYLLDTSSVSDLIGNDSRMKSWVGSLEPDDTVAICSIVKGEVLFGIARLASGKRRSDLQRAAADVLDHLVCYSVDEAASSFYASVKLRRQRTGLSMAENDLWIAATALAVGAKLVSRDSDYIGIDGLEVITPA